MEYHCNCCGDLVIEKDLRDHAELHNPNARGFDWEWLLTLFTLDY
jgi:hypothetical protein